MNRNSYIDSMRKTAIYKTDRVKMLIAGVQIMYDLNTQLNNKFLLIRRLIIKSARKFRQIF